MPSTKAAPGGVAAPTEGLDKGELAPMPILDSMNGVL